MSTTICIKIGSGILFTARHKPDEFRIAHIAEQVRALRARGIGAVLVVSGAVACGSRLLSASGSDARERRMAAGIGQVLLMRAMHECFAAKGMEVAQVLLTPDALSGGERRHALRELLSGYLELGIVPVINENDAIELNGFGGNDLLAANIVSLMKGERLVMLSSMAGSAYGVGGGETKRQAIERLRGEGIHACIVDGKERDVIVRHAL